MDGSKTEHPSPGHGLMVNLKGDRKMAPPVLVVDRPTDEGREATRYQDLSLHYVYND